VNNSITEIKNTLYGINSTLEGEQEWISKLEGRVMESNKVEQEKEKRNNKNKNWLRKLSNNIKHNNIHIIQITENKREKREQKIYLKK